MSFLYGKLKFLCIIILYRKPINLEDNVKKSRFLFIIIISIFLIFSFEVSAMQIFIKKIDSENIRLEVESSDTIEMVKEKKLPSR